MDRYGRPGAGARQGGAAFPPSPPGVSPSPGVLPAGTPGTLGKCVTGQQLTYIRSPDAAPEPERMTYHRSPDGPTSSLLSSVTSSSSVARSIGYITTSPTKKHCPRITIERNPPEGAARGAPTSGHRGGSYPGRPPLLPLPPAPPALPLGERSPPPFDPTPGWMPFRPSTTSSLWAPHRDISGRAEDFRSPPLPPSSGFPSPPSYRETLLRFPSPDLPPPVSPVSSLQQHQQQQQQHHHQQHHQHQQQQQHQHQQQRHRSYSPLMVAPTLAAEGKHHFDLDLVPGKLDPLQTLSRSPQLPVHNVFDRRSLPPPPPLPLPPLPLPSSTPHRHATSGLRVSTGNGNAMPLTPLLGVVTSGAPHHRMAAQPPPPPPPPPPLPPPGAAAPRMSSGGHLSERGSSPRKRPYPGGEVEGILREHPRGLYDGRYASWALGGGGSGEGDGGTQSQSVPLNMSTIKENNGCKVWRDTETLGQRPIARPRIPWGIENIPLEEEEDLKAMVPKKRRENDPPRYQCEACKKSYATHGGLSKHRQFHCTSIIKKEFSCKSCDKTYVSLGALKMHIRTHTLPCKCHLCGKAFARPWLLQGHIRTHTGEKPYQCAHCGRSFADRSNLRAHLQTHTDIKKYNCRSCSKSFSRMSLLSKHEDGGCGNTSV